MSNFNIAVITGASSGIGYEFVLQLDNLEHFDEIWLISRREDRLKELSSKLNAKTRILPLDLTVLEDLEKYKAELELYTPNVRYLVNAAGFGKFGNYKEVDIATSMKMIDINDKATVYMSMTTLDYMTIGGRIINMGSASSFFPLVNFNVYASTKAFIVHYSNALHDELKPRGINVTVSCPGWVATPFFDVADNNDQTHGPKKYAPMLDPKEVVRRAIDACIKGKKMSVYNWYTKFHRFGARFFPRSFMLWQWKKIQKKVK